MGDAFDYDIVNLQLNKFFIQISRLVCSLDRGYKEISYELFSDAQNTLASLEIS